MCSLKCYSKMSITSLDSDFLIGSSSYQICIMVLIRSTNHPCGSGLVWYPPGAPQSLLASRSLATPVVRRSPAWKQDGRQLEGKTMENIHRTLRLSHTLLKKFQGKLLLKRTFLVLTLRYKRIKINDWEAIL